MIRHQDIFGQKVELTFKGQKNFKTTIGAVISIFIKVILALFIWYEVYVIFSRKHPAISIS